MELRTALLGTAFFIASTSVAAAQARWEVATFESGVMAAYAEDGDRTFTVRCEDNDLQIVYLVPVETLDPALKGVNGPVDLIMSIDDETQYQMTRIVSHRLSTDGTVGFRGDTVRKWAGRRWSISHPCACGCRPREKRGEGSGGFDEVATYQRADCAAATLETLATEAYREGAFVASTRGSGEAAVQQPGTPGHRKLSAVCDPSAVPEGRVFADRGAARAWADSYFQSEKNK